MCIYVYVFLVILHWVGYKFIVVSKQHIDISVRATYMNLLCLENRYYISKECSSTYGSVALGCVIGEIKFLFFIFLLCMYQYNYYVYAYCIS